MWCSAAITTPFDVVKTRLQTQGVQSARRYKGTAVVRPVLFGAILLLHGTDRLRRCGLQIHTMKQIAREEGWPALWRGVRPRVMFNAPAAAICWGTYESMKVLLERTDSAAGR